MYIKLLGLFLLGLSLCSGKRSHHGKHGVKKITDLGKEKFFITNKLLSLSKTVNNVSKKQSLGMPLNNNDEQGLGGEPVGHLDASEGVGGLGGDQDGVPIGMGAGAEPLGMAKGKEMSENGGMMQGLNEDSESLHENEDLARPFNEQQGGDFIEGEHGENTINGHPSNFMPNGGNSMNMLGGASHGGMGNFMGSSNGHGENFMEHENDEESYKGPKKDPLGAEIRPFNDEFKNKNSGSHIVESNTNNGGSFMSPMRNDSDEHDLASPSNGDEIVNGNMASIQGDNDMGNSMGMNSFKGPKKDPLGAEIKPFNDEHKSDIGSEEEEESPGDHSMNFMGRKDKDGFSKEKEDDERTGSLGGESEFSNPSPSDIGKALNGNLAALDSVNIQGDSDVAEMVRKATHQKEFARKGSGTLNGISLMDPGYSSTTKQFFGSERGADRRTKKGSHAHRVHAKNKVARGKDSRKKHSY